LAAPGGGRENSLKSVLIANNDEAGSGMTIKTWVRQRAPFLVPVYSYPWWNLVIRPRWRRMGMGVFAEHFRKNGWGSAEFVSGMGSTLEETQAVRQALPELVKSHAIRSMLDIPCGDFNWMQALDLRLKYIGADIVEELVLANQEKYDAPDKIFVRLNLVADELPRADLVLCRDCLFHFSFEHAKQALENIKRSGAKYLLATTNIRMEKNRDIVTGEWRRLNLQRPPFSLPEPLLLIDEKCPDPAAPDKYLGLWRVADL
jgi:SAM-dependent methyltransferase